MHEHGHEHEHEHEHGHGHNHEHGHHGHEGAPGEELTAMLRYMVGHNAAHTRELAELAGQLETDGRQEQYEQVMQAVAEYQHANGRLQAVLETLE